MNFVWTKSQKEILYKYKSYRQHFTNSELLESEDIDENGQGI